MVETAGVAFAKPSRATPIASGRVHKLMIQVQDKQFQYAEPWDDLLTSSRNLAGFCFHPAGVRPGVLGA